MRGKKLLIFGAGQYGHVARETALAMNCFDRIGFLDDHGSAALGKLEEYERFFGEFDCAFVAMGNPVLRLQWLNRLEKAGYALPVLIHPMAYVSASAVLSAGTIVEPMAVVHTDAVVEKGGLLCAGCVVNHNSILKPCCQIDCNAVVESGAVVPEGTKVASCSVFARNQ